MSASSGVLTTSQFPLRYASTDGSGTHSVYVRLQCFLFFLFWSLISAGCASVPPEYPALPKGTEHLATATMSPSTVTPGMAVPSVIPGVTEKPSTMGIPFRTVAQEALLGDKPSSPVYRVITRADQWDGLRGQLPEQAIQIGAQFNQLNGSLLVMAFAGVKGTSGYSMAIQNIVQEDSQLTVVVSEIAPRPDESVEPAKTLPYHLVAISKTSLHLAPRLVVEFRDTQGAVLSRQELQFQ